MKYIIGAYSQLPTGSSKEEYEALVSRQLKPLLTMIYNNSDMKLLFRLSISEFDYLESFYPEINMLISELCRRGQIEILSFSYYDVILSMIPTHERSSQIEKTTTYIRKHFSRKPKGLWLYNQVFNPTTIPVVGLCGLNYIVISTYNQISNSVEFNKPFYTDEMGKEILVLPTDDRFSKLTSDLYRGGLSLDRYLSDSKALIEDASGPLCTIMLNLDQMMATSGSCEVFKTIFTKAGKDSTLPAQYIAENEISKTHFLPAGLYGRDYSIGKSTSINQLIYDNSMLSRHYCLVNMLREVLHDCRKSIADRKNLDNLMMMASCSSLYFPNECSSPQIRRQVNKYACEIESTLSMDNGAPMPVETDIDFDRSKELLVTGRSGIAYLSRKGGVLSRFTIPSLLFDIAFHSGDGLFADSFVQSGKGETSLASKVYEVTPLDKRNLDFFAKAPTLNLGKIPVSLTKRYKFRQSSLVLEVEIENLSDGTLKGFDYICTINLALPYRFSCLCPEGELEGDMPVTTQSVTFSDKGNPFSLTIVLGEDALVSKTDFETKARTWLGDKSFYEYTQLRIQKQLSLGPYETYRLSIGFKTEKRKEKHNDTTEQSAP